MHMYAKGDVAKGMKRHGCERDNQDGRNVKWLCLLMTLSFILGNFPCCLDQGSQRPERLGELEEGVL